MIPFNVPPCVGDELEYVKQAIDAHKICGDGAFTKMCNNWMEERFHTQKVLLTTSGTTALDMAMLLCGLQPGDEVILPSFTFSSTATAAVLAGARLVFVDVRPDTMNIDETKIEAAITDKTKVIVAMHYAGVACEMDTIMDIARRHNLMVVEDAARSLVWLPVLAVVLVPINAERSTLSTYFDEMGSQITAVETALQERMDARASADPWDNTLAYAYADDVFHGYLYAVPAGMGIEFDMNTYIADPEETIYSRYAMVNHGTDAEARLVADGWQPLISTEDLIVYERPDTQ